MTPYSFPISEIDRSQLPPENRNAQGSVFEEAVCRFLLNQHQNNSKPVIAIVRNGIVTIAEVPEISDAVELLSQGKTQEGMDLCDLILAHDPNNIVILFNSGMALSDLGKIELSINRLNKAYDLAPSASCAIAIGVAHSRNKDDAKALNWLRRAVDLEPDNIYAVRNLGVILLKVGMSEEALQLLEPLAKNNPLDQSAIYAYGQALLASGLNDRADKAFVSAIGVAPYSPIADAAKESRSKIAHDKFREKAGSSSIRMDAVMYLVDALRTYSSMPSDKQMALFQEIAIIGMRGLDVNDPTPKYTLRSIPEKFLSGLHMTCFMHEGGKRFIPQANMGFDLSKEYEAAKQLFLAGGKNA